MPRASGAKVLWPRPEAAGVADAMIEAAFNILMTDLKNDFYRRFDADMHRYQFACKLLRDWWLRHYGMMSRN
jgi:hypothetical protein